MKLHDSAARRDGDALVLPTRAACADRCWQCAAPSSSTVHLKRQWHHPAWYLMFLAGLVPYLIAASFVRKPAELLIGLCPLHTRRRRTALLTGLGLLAATVGLWALSIKGLAEAATGLAGAATLLASITVLMIRSNVVRVKRVDDVHAWYANPAPALLVDLAPLHLAVGTGIPSARAVR